MNSELRTDPQDLIRAAATEAGALALRWFRPGEPTSARVWTKGKGSPVTEADIEVDAFLRRRLSAAGEAFGWLSEETADSPERLKREFVFVVDPIDGTRAFIAGDPRWCVSIALVASGSPIAAAVHAPALAATYEATSGGPALKNGASVAVSGASSLARARIAGPRSLLEALADQGSGIVPVAKIPSLAYRLCQVADGSLEAALASRDANDWDIAAAHLILERAGGRLGDLDGRTPRYNRLTTAHDRLFAASAGGFEPMLSEVRRVVGLPAAPRAATA
jgi:myo-inositol-1(or 4)-monophosphatase